MSLVSAISTAPMGVTTPCKSMNNPIRIHTCTEASSKSAKKNAKRHSKSKSDSGKSTFTIKEDIGHEAPPQATPTATPTKPPCDPIVELKKQIEEAKAVKVREGKRKAEWARHPTATYFPICNSGHELLKQSL